MNRKDRLPLALVLLAVCLVYANSFSNEFHFDDFHTVVDNPAIRSLGNLRRIVTDVSAFSVLPANQTYRPVVTASLALDYALGHGYVLFWFHLSTLIWFLVLVTMLYLLAELLFERQGAAGASRWLALGVAAWFGLHPAMAETVNYVIQRGDLYGTLGCVAALYLFVRWPARRRFGLYLIPFALALLSKPPAAVFPLLLWLFLLLFEEVDGPAWRRTGRALVSVAPALAVTAGALWLQAAMTPKSFQPSILSPVSYRLTQPFVWLRYGLALFLPLHLNVDTDLQPFAAVNGRALLGFGFLALLLVAIAASARRRRWYPICFGLGWFVLTELPTSLYPLSEVENDHRMFFAFPGLMMAVVWAMYLLSQIPVLRSPARQRLVSHLAGAGTALCLAGYAYGAHRRNTVWHSEATLWADDVAKSPHNGRGLMIYGLTEMNAGRYPEALQTFTRAQQYTPNYPTLEINLGIVNGLLAVQGHPELTPVAEQHFQRALALAPEDDTTHGYYGRWLLGLGRLPEATDQLKVAVRLNPLRPMQRDLLLRAYLDAGNDAAARALASETLAMIPTDAEAAAVSEGRPPAGIPEAAALINASLAAYRAGQYQSSVDLARAALRLDPRSAEAWNNVGAGYGAMHRWPEAIDAEENALRWNATLQIARNNLLWFQREGRSGPAQSSPGTAADYVNRSLQLNRQGRFQESIAAAQTALQLDPNSAEAWNNIAAGDEALHRWNEAIAAAQKALQLRPDFTLAHNNLVWSLQQQQQQRAAPTH